MINRIKTLYQSMKDIERDTDMLQKVTRHESVVHLVDRRNAALEVYNRTKFFFMPSKD